MKKGPYKLFPIIILVFFMLFVYIYFHIESERLAYKIGELRKLSEKEKNINTQLHISLSRLSSPERLDKIAKDMKFCSPSKMQIIEIAIKNEGNK